MLVQINVEERPDSTLGTSRSELSVDEPSFPCKVLGKEST